MGTIIISLFLFTYEGDYSDKGVRLFGYVNLLELGSDITFANKSFSLAPHARIGFSSYFPLKSNKSIGVSAGMQGISNFSSNIEEIQVIPCLFLYFCYNWAKRMGSSLLIIEGYCGNGAFQFFRNFKFNEIGIKVSFELWASKIKADWMCLPLCVPYLCFLYYPIGVWSVSYTHLTLPTKA